MFSVFSIYDPDLIIEGLTPQQERLLKALPNYAIGWAENAGFNDIAEEIKSITESPRAYRVT